MSTIFDASALIQKARTFTCKTGLGLEPFAEAVVANLPELKQKHMKYVKRKSKVIHNYTPQKVKINGQKLTLDTLEFSELMPGQVLVSVEYSTPSFRPFLFLFTCIGLLFGVIPGIIIYMIGREPADEEVKLILPVLERFGAILDATEEGTL